MKPNTPRTWGTAVLVCLIAVCFVTVTGWLLASPSDEITKALTANGTSDVQKAGSTAFIDAFAAALVEVDQSETASYVAAAVKLRPDLKDQIAAVATEVDGAGVELDYRDRDGDGDGDGDCVSRHRRRVRICCNGHTYVLSKAAARRYLHTHPRCTQGACPYETPRPHV